MPLINIIFPEVEENKFQAYSRTAARILGHICGPIFSYASDLKQAFSPSEGLACLLILLMGSKASQLKTQLSTTTLHLSYGHYSVNSKERFNLPKFLPCSRETRGCFNKLFSMCAFLILQRILRPNMIYHNRRE